MFCHIIIIWSAVWRSFFQQARTLCSSFLISKILPCLLTKGLAFFYTTIYQTWPFILLSKFDYFFYKLLSLTFYKIYIIQPPGGVLIREGKKSWKKIIIIDKKLRSILLFILIQQANEKPFIINNILAKDKKKELRTLRLENHRRWLGHVILSLVNNCFKFNKDGHFFHFSWTLRYFNLTNSSSLR